MKSASRQTSSLSESESQTLTLCTVKKKTASANYIFRETPCLLGIHTRKLSFFLFFLEWSTAAEIRSTEERLLFNLTTQPGLCAPRGDDPYKSVSVYAEAAMILLLRKILFEGTCWGLTEQARFEGGKNELTLSLPNLFFGLSCGLWHSGTLQLHSLPLSIWKRSLWIRTANLSSCLRVDVSQSILKSVPRLSLSLSLFISCDARNTHQGAVVQESRGEVAVEAERQDVSFPAANSHFVLWQGWDSSEKTVVCYYSDDLKSTRERDGYKVCEPEAQSQVRSLKWALCHSGVISEWKRGIITVQPGHAGVMNFELFTLQILHGEMGAEQQVRFIFRGNETGVN